MFRKCYFNCWRTLIDFLIEYYYYYYNNNLLLAELDFNKYCHFFVCCPARWYTAQCSEVKWRFISWLSWNNNNNNYKYIFAHRMQRWPTNKCIYTLRFKIMFLVVNEVNSIGVSKWIRANIISINLIFLFNLRPKERTSSIE